MTRLGRSKAPATYGAEQAAVYLKCTIEYVRKLFGGQVPNRPRLGGVKNGKSWLTTEKALQRFLSGQDPDVQADILDLMAPACGRQARPASEARAA